MTSKLSVKIVLSIAFIAAITAAVLGFFAFNFTKSTIVRLVTDSQEELARQTMDKIDRIFYERYGDIQAIAGNSVFAELLADPAGKNDGLLIDKVFRRLKDLSLVSGPWHVLFIVDMEGTIVASTPRGKIGELIDTEPHRQEAYRAVISGNVYYSDYLLLDDDGKPTVFFAAPIVDTTQSAKPVVGVVIGGFAWPVTEQILEELHAQAILLNKNGEVIAANMDKVSAKNLLCPTKKGICVLDQFKKGRRASFVTETDLSLKKILVSLVMQKGYLHYGGSGWGLVLAQPVNVAFVPASSNAFKLMSIVIGFVIILSFFFLLIAVKLIVRPITALTEMTQAIAGGDLSRTVHVSTHDEIGQLAVSFNAMTVKLKNFYDELEEKVRQRTEALTESEAYVRQVIETAADAFIAIDENGQVIDWNRQAEQTFGWSREEILGKELAETVMPEKYRVGHREGLKKFLQTGEGPVLGKRLELSALHKTGREFPIEIVIWAVPNKSGIFFNAFVRDVTQSKKMETQLLQSQKMETVGTLTGGIAHDLNNQMTPVIGYLDLLLQQTKTQDPTYAILTDARDAAQRCVDVVQRLLNFSRPSTNKKELFNLHKLIGELQKFLKNVLPANIRVDFSCPEGLWPIEGNFTEIQTVLMNLATNSRDAMKSQGGELRISAQNIDFDPQHVKPGHTPGHYVVLDIRDTGEGISPEDLSHIFDPFFTTKRKEGGTGLGLATAFNIVKDHAGWMDVSSQKGQGTIFHIYLPAKPGASFKGQSTPVQEALPMGKETILFADDEETIRNLGKVFLERLGYRVLLAADGQTAMDIYRDKKDEIALVILDMTMPRFTGRQTLQGILTINPKAKIVVSSGYTMEGTAQELIRDGAVDFLPKPYMIMPLARAVRKAIDGK